MNNKFYIIFKFINFFFIKNIKRKLLYMILLYIILYVKNDSQRNISIYY